MPTPRQMANANHWLVSRLSLLLIVGLSSLFLLPTNLWASHDPDLNDDGIVNILDISLAGSCFGQDPTSNTQCQIADLNHDNAIDLTDINILSGSFGQTFPIDPTNPNDIDDDGDGFTEAQGDCNDGNAAINPDATDIPGNDIDEDCSGSDAPLDPLDVDDDGDGFTEAQGDCNDSNEAINPDATDIPGNDIDEDCSGSDAPLDPLDVDDDGDGFTETQGDCNDGNAAINPDATDIPGNDIDENCDGQDAPLDPLDVDNDGDGFTETQGDCNDSNAAINPDATDIPGNGIDEDCDGEDAALPNIASLEPAQLTILTSDSGTMTVQIQNPTVGQETFIDLSSAVPTIVDVPTQVSIQAGETSTTFQVTGLMVGGPVLITATLGISSATAEITVVDQPTPPGIVGPLAAGSTNITGSGVANALIDILVNTVQVSMGIIDANGMFDVVVPVIQTGDVVQATQTVNGFTSAPSVEVTVQPIPPAPMITVPVVEGMTEAQGTGQPGATVDLFINGASIATGVVPSTGAFTLPTPALIAGQQVTAIQMVAGIRSISSAPVAVVMMPAPPIITIPIVAGAQTVAGTGVNGATVEVSVDGNNVGTTTVNTSNTWSLTLAMALLATEEVQAKQVVNDVSSALSAAVKVVALPPPPVVTEPVVAGNSTISGTGSNGATIDIFVNSVSVGTASVNVAGLWEIQGLAALGAGQMIEASQTVGGVLSTLSAQVTVVAPPPPPVVSSPLITGETAISGTGTVGASVEVFVDNAPEGTTTVGMAGAWSVALMQALQTGQAVTATQTVSGISSLASVSVTAVAPPPIPTVTGPIFDGRTDVNGTGIVGASVDVFIDGSNVGSTNVDANGDWALMVSPVLQTGQAITATQTVAGIPSSPSAPIIVEEIVLTEIEIDPFPTAAVELNQAVQFSAKGMFSDGSMEDPLTNVVWNSDATNIVSIDTIGLATGQSLGMAKIHASRDGVDSLATIMSVMTAGSVITNFQPKSSSTGESITIMGTNLLPATPGALSVTLAQQGGGRIEVPVTTSQDSTVVFTVPPGATTGDLEILIDQLPVLIPPSATFTVVASSNFSLSVEPSTADLIQGQSTSYKVTLDSNTGFTQLADLSVSGLPAGVTADFTPPQISAEQTAILTIIALAAEPTSSANLLVSASATVDGILLQETGNAALNIQPVTTSFIGRTVVADPLQTSLAGVTIKMLGQDGNGGSTGCSGEAISDAAGNFTISNLPVDCIGNQLVRFDGATATFPIGVYAGVDKRYNLVQDQVTQPPVLVHLPRIDNADTVMVQQNATVDQFFTFPTIPNLSITVYAGTIFTLENGQQPNPFKLTAIEIPVDRLPGGNLPASANDVIPFLVGFQPANTRVNQPVPIAFPNTAATPPGTQVPLTTLDPTQGIMVNYGTGTISPNGTQILPDSDSSNSGKNFGLTHLGWHGGRPPAPVDIPAPPPQDVGGCSAQAVNFNSGQEVQINTDIAFQGARGSLIIQREYWSGRSNQGPFGLKTSHNFSHRLDTNTPANRALISLILPDGNRIPFARQTDGTYINETTPAVRGSQMRVASNGEVELKLKNCDTMLFVPSTFPLGSLLQSRTDRNGNQINIERDPSNPVRITKIIDPVGRFLTLSYDRINRITKINDHTGRTVQYTYNLQGTLETVTDPEGKLKLYDYDDQNRLTRITDARGLIVSELTYGNNDRVVQEKMADGGIIKFDYTFLNPQVRTSRILMTKVTDPLGRVTKYDYNAQGYLKKVTDALGQITLFEREIGTNLIIAQRGFARCTICRHPGSGDSKFTYDNNGNVLTVTNSMNETSIFTYHPIINKVTSSVDPLGHKTTASYDNKGNLSELVDENGNVTTFSYNGFGLPTRVIDPNGSETQFSYDAEGNLITVTDAQKHETRMEYDVLSRHLATIDPLGRRHEKKYDKLNRLIGVKDAFGQEATFIYDEVGNVLKITDPRGKSNVYTYDNLNRMISRTDPLGHIETLVYDLAGNLVALTDRRGHRNQFTYDDIDRLVQESYQDGARVWRFYSRRSLLIRVEDSSGGVYRASYDPVGRILIDSNSIGQVKYTYDRMGHVLSRQVVGQPSVIFSYDPVGNLLSASLPKASAKMTYSSRNFLENVELSNGVNSGYKYDTLGRLETVVHLKGTMTLEKQEYSYDAVGNRTKSTANFGQSLITQSTVNTFDDNNRMLSRGPVTFTYDSNGNRLTETDTLGTKKFTWDSRNRLERLHEPAGETTFRYDFAGNLVEKTDIDGNGIIRKKLVLDDLGNLIHEFESNGRNLNVLSGVGVDRHIAITRSNGITEFSLADGLNSTAITVDKTGLQTGAFGYEPYGETKTNNPFPFQYTGRVPVSDNLYYYRARYYDPIAGRFLSEDPIGFSSGDVNLYAYVQNNPINIVDPSGLKDRPPIFWPNPKIPIGPPTPINPNDPNDPNNQAGFNCHSYTWHGGLGDPTDPRNNRSYPRWDQNPSDDLDGWTKLDPNDDNVIGDRVIYWKDDNGDQVRQDNEITHSGTVTGVDRKGYTTEVTSKWGQRPIYRHHPHDVPKSYGSNRDYYR